MAEIGLELLCFTVAGRFVLRMGRGHVLMRWASQVGAGASPSSSLPGANVGVKEVHRWWMLATEQGNKLSRACPFSFQESTISPLRTSLPAP